MILSSASHRSVALLFVLLPARGVLPPAGVAEAPAARNKPAVAFDPTRKVMVLFGGFPARGSDILQDSWEWSEAGWRRLPSPGLPPRAAAGVTTDVRRGRVVLFGGHDGSGARGETLEWDGATWSRVADTGPSARTVPQLAYDSRRGRTVLFGGWDDKEKRVLGDTWE